MNYCRVFLPVGPGFASTRSSGPPEFDQCRESGAAASPPYVSGSQPETPVAPLAARPARHPAVDRATPLGDSSRLTGSCLTTPPDSAGHRPLFRHRESPSRDRAPSVDSSPSQIFADGLITAPQLTQRR